MNADVSSAGHPSRLVGIKLTSARLRRAKKSSAFICVYLWPNTSSRLVVNYRFAFAMFIAARI
jgi:nitrate reductase NapE component